MTDITTRNPAETLAASYNDDSSLAWVWDLVAATHNALMPDDLEPDEWEPNDWIQDSIHSLAEHLASVSQLRVSGYRSADSMQSCGCWIALYEDTDSSELLGWAEYSPIIALAELERLWKERRIYETLDEMLGCAQHAALKTICEHVTNALENERGVEEALT